MSSFRRSTVTGIVISVLAVASSWYFTDFRLYQLATVATYAIAMLGLNLLTGYNGQISLGHGAFMGVGAYTVAVLVRDHAVPYFVAILAAFLLTFVIGALIGIPALRLSGASLALITLAAAVALPQLLKKFDSVTGGAQGLNLPSKSQLVSPWESISDDQFRYLVIIGATIVIFWVCWNLVRSRWGLAMMSVRDNPVSAASMGVHLSRTKVTTFAISAGLAGIAGGFQMILVGFISPESVTLTISIAILTGIVVGGLATVLGPIIGGLFVVFMPNYAVNISDSAPGVVYGVIIILVILLAPGGVMGLLRKLEHVVRRRSNRSPAPDSAPDSAPVDVRHFSEPQETIRATSSLTKEAL